MAMLLQCLEKLVLTFDAPAQRCEKRLGHVGNHVVEMKVKGIYLKLEWLKEGVEEKTKGKVVTK